MPIPREQAERITVTLVELITAIVRDEMDSRNGSGDSFSGCAAYRCAQALTDALVGESDGEAEAE
jgi:hypothetical protein